MASPDRHETDHLIQQIFRDPRRTDFFLLVRVLQSLFKEPPKSGGEAGLYPRVGEAASPSREPVRFGQPPFLHFAPTAVESMQWRTAPASGPCPLPGIPGDPRKDLAGAPPGSVPGARVKVMEMFFGLFGPNGPLPLHITEYAMIRWRHHKDPVLMEFADLFHHRMVSYFFRAWAEARMEVDFDRGLAASRFGTYVGSLMGLGHESVRGRDSIPDVAKLHYVGHLGRQVRNADGLAAIIGDYFQVKAEVLTFQGRWIELPPECRCRLGASPSSGELGRTALLGTRTWDSQTTIRIRLGPMGLTDLERFLPGRVSFDRLRDWIRFYCNQPFFWDAQIVLLKKEIPPLKLGESGRLGWTSWLTTKLLAEDAADPDDLVLRPADAC